MLLFPTEPVALDRLEMFAAGLDHAEGIAVAPDGTIFVGGEGGQIYRIGQDDEIEQIYSTGGFILGLAMDGEGRIYAIDNVHKTVWRIDPSGGEAEPFTVGTTERPLNVPNWGCFDQHGNYYLSDSGDWGEANGFMWIVRPGGETAVWTEATKDFPNGCAVAPDGSRLYYVESIPGRICEIEILADGSAGQRRVLCELGLAVPDGVAVASDGALIVACYRPDVIYRWYEKTGLEILAGDPQGVTLAAPTNVAFTGPDLGMMIVPNLGRWHLTRGHLGVFGSPLFYPTRTELGQ